MEFWDTFWATMWGALAGAVVGALAAWLFALDLRRRGRRDSYRNNLDAAVASLIGAILRYNAAGREEAAGNGVGRHLVLAPIFEAIRVARMRAAGADDKVIDAAREVVADNSAVEGSDARSKALTEVTKLLMGWRKGELCPEQARLKILGQKAPTR